MKKITIAFIIFGVFLVGFISADILTNKAEALSYLNTLISQKDQKVSDRMSKIIFTSDKNCMIDESQDIQCWVCFKFEGEKEETCINIDSDTSFKDDKKKILEAIEYMIRETTEKIEVQYKEYDLNGTELEFELSKDEKPLI